MNTICVIGVYVSDLVKARELYCEKLGFAVKGEYGDCILQLENGATTFIMEKIEGDYPEKPCIVLATQTDDLAAEIERLKKTGIKFIHKTTNITDHFITTNPNIK